jgi:hypothetical protein
MKNATTEIGGKERVVKARFVLSKVHRDGIRSKSEDGYADGVGIKNT